MNEWLAHNRFPFGLCQTQQGYCWRMSTGKSCTGVNDCCVAMLGVLSILLWSMIASHFLLQEEVPCLSECLSLYRQLVRKVGKLRGLFQEQTPTNQLFTLSRTTLSFAHSSLSKEPQWNRGPFVLFNNILFIGFPPFLSHISFWKLPPKEITYTQVLVLKFGYKQT